MASAPNPYGDGKAATRIAGALEHILLGKHAPEQFGPGYSRDAVALAAGFGPDDAVAFEMLEGLLGPVPAVTAETEEPSFLVEG